MLSISFLQHDRRVRQESIEAFQSALRLKEDDDISRQLDGTCVFIVVLSVYLVVLSVYLVVLSVFPVAFSVFLVVLSVFLLLLLHRLGALKLSSSGSTSPTLSLKSTCSRNR